MKNKFPPILFSLPVIDRLSLPPRAQILPRIESGELDHIDFVARVFNTAPNTNHYAFPQASLSGFASSFEDQPYLRNHDTYDIDARPRHHPESWPWTGTISARPSASPPEGE